MSITTILAMGAANAAKSIKDALPGEAIELALQLADNSDTDLVRYSKPGRVDPLCLVDSSTLTIPFTSDVLKVGAKLFMAYYLTAISMDNKVGGISVKDRIGRFNPNPDLQGASAALLSALDPEGVGRITVNQADLIDPHSAVLPGMSTMVPALESTDPKKPNINDKDQLISRVDTNKQIQQLETLAVGSIVDLELNHDGKTVIVPIHFNMRPVGANPDNIISVMDFATYDGSAKARWRQFRAGEIRFWADVVAASDRVAAYQKAAAKDKTGFFQESADRTFGGLARAALSGETSPGAAAAILVVNKTTMDEFKRTHQQDMSQYATRERFFDASKIMLMFEIDEEWDVVRLYTRSVDAVNTYSIRDLKSAAKSDGGDDLKTLINAMTGGRGLGRV
jgi:hypothetical protein